MHNLFYFLWCLLHDLRTFGKMVNPFDILDIVTENSEIFLTSSKIFIANFFVSWNKF